MRNFLTAMTALSVGAMASTQAFAQEVRNPAAEWEELWNTVIIDITIIGVIMAIAAVWMLIKYRATSPDQVGTAKRLTTVQAISFALIPAAIFMADDFYLAAKGWTVWNAYRRVPENAIEIKVTAYQWYFEFEYPDGTETEELKMPIGEPVVLRMTSEDVLHNFGVPEYRVKEDVMPGRITYIWINPVEAKETIVQCAEFCGQNHSEMTTKVSAVPREEYDAWLAKIAAED
ncbi:MAG: cytochrome c oxidase subunit II [Magnetovibrio sp.]|nr:cytochrome c oxidase subunit II [Magnetovibrio sp.]